MVVRLLEDTLGKDPGGHQPTLLAGGPPFVLVFLASRYSALTNAMAANSIGKNNGPLGG